MILEWSVDEGLDFDPVLVSQMQAAADYALIAEGIRAACFACVRLCDDKAICEINTRERNVNHATDVLSFPSVRFPTGKTAHECENLLRQAYDDEQNACFLGDIIISIPHAQSQAKEYGHSPAREAAYLLVHGLCHLFGYDHIEENDKIKMRRKEEEILASVGLFRNESVEQSDNVILRLAREAQKHSYSPYSGFSVGAALLAEDGRIFQGCNIENASYGVGICAERTAVFKAVSEGARSFKAIAIAADTIAWPCGACRQVLNEFAPDIRVLVTDAAGNVDEKNLRDLLPNSFGPEKLLH